MDTLNFDWPISAGTLLQQAKSHSNLARLIMDGINEVESWLIAHRIVPALQEKNLGTVHFHLACGADKRHASLLRLPDGSAFACNVLGTWFALEQGDAAREVQYIGSRYAPGDRWLGGFQATLGQPGGTETALTPTGLARVWAETTGMRLNGFEVGILDHLQAVGYDVADKIFNTQGRLGL